MSLIAGVPIMAGALLMMSGLLDLRLLDAHGAATIRPSALTILVSPLSRVPEAWLWGALGGFIGKCIARRRRAVTPAGLSG
jgi:hypothetical protein